MSSMLPIGDFGWSPLEFEIIPEVEKISHSPVNSFNIEKWMESNIEILSSKNGVCFYDFLTHPEWKNFTNLNRNIRLLLSKERDELISRFLSSKSKRLLFNNKPKFLLIKQPLITTYSLNRYNFTYCNRNGVGQIVPVFLCKISELVNLLKNHPSSSFLKRQISTFFLIEDRFIKIKDNHLRTLNAFERFEKLKHFEIPNSKSLQKLKKNLYELNKFQYNFLERGCKILLDRLESFAKEKSEEARHYYSNYSEDESLSNLLEKELKNIQDENMFLAKFFKSKLGFIHVKNPANEVLTFNVISEKTLAEMLSESLKNLEIRGYSKHKWLGRIMKIKIPKLDLEKESKEEESENSNEIQKYLHSVNYPSIPINHPFRLSIRNLLNNQEEITEKTFIVCLELLKKSYPNLAIDLTFINRLPLRELIFNSRLALESFDPSTIQVASAPNVIIPFISSGINYGIMWIDTMEKKLEFLYISSNGYIKNYDIVNFLSIFYKAYFPENFETSNSDLINRGIINAQYLNKEDRGMYAFHFCQSRLQGISFETFLTSLPFLMEIHGLRDQLARKLIES